MTKDTTSQVKQKELICQSDVTEEVSSWDFKLYLRKYTKENPMQDTPRRRVLFAIVF